MGMPVVPGATLHMDYFEAWSPFARAAFHGNCIDKHLNGSNGDLCTGMQMKEASVPAGFFPIPPLVPVN